MNFNLYSTIADIQEACNNYQKSIDCVSEVWDDQVSESAYDNIVPQLMNAGTTAFNVLYNRSKTIDQLLDEMEMYARR